MPTSELRPELTPLPARIASLPVDRGYPVPWFVEWITNEAGERVPEFRASSRRKWAAAIAGKLCWVCGQKLGSHKAFVLGPMCGITRTTSEPPCHLDCAIWSAMNCPFLVRPHATRREVEGSDPPPGMMIARNPGVALVWVTRAFKLFNDGKGGKLIEVGDPEGVLFYSLGKAATSAQIRESVSTGLPFLEATLEGPESAQALQAAIATFEALIPA